MTRLRHEKDKQIEGNIIKDEVIKDRVIRDIRNLF